MYFKSLEIVGFKSFLNKTKLKFEPGVTTIVGPNGCGKSNVVDAIKWVLGEQSVRSMRSTSMQDVIFSGTDDQEPVNMAEVSLTLSNEDRALALDYDEVTISRRLFRSGESAYFLNKMPVRLADVRGLLMGTGIGTSAYSIIEQGSMDLILNAKPEERRHIFEEASGITKYRAKKREALLKLEHTRNNLVRIGDIIHEVERQIKMIERQARKAEKYKVLYDQMKDIDVKLSFINFSSMQTDDSSLKEKNEEIKSFSEKLKSDLETSSRTLSRQREEYNIIMQSLHESQSEIMRLSSDVDKNSHVIKVNEERIHELQRSTERLGQEIDEVRERRDTLRSRLEKLEVRCTDIGSRREEKERELAGDEEALQKIIEIVEDHKERLKTNHEKTVDIISEQTQTKNTLIKMNADIQNMVARERRLRIEKSNVEDEKDAASEELENYEEKLELAGKTLDDKRREFNDFNNTYSGKQQELFSLNEDKKKKEKRLNEVKPRREFLEKLISEREGIGESVKEIMKRVESGDSRFAGVFGILSEIISVSEGYEESLEFILGDLAQAMVVESRSAANSIIGFLEENSLSNVSFLILDEMKSFVHDGNPAPGSEEKLENIAQVLTGEEPYRSALCSMLCDVFVSSSDGASQSLVETEEELKGRIIGKKGEVRQKGMYRSRNYSEREMVSLFGRKEKVEQLREEEGSINRELAEIGEGISLVEEWLKESVAKKQTLEAELRERQMEFADAQSRRDAVKEKVKELTDEVMLLHSDLEEEVANIKQLKEEGVQLNQKLNELETENATLQQLIEESQRIIQEGTHDREKKLYEISDIKVELSAFRKEEENLVENLNREKDNYSRIDAETKDRQERITNNTERTRTLEEEIRNLKQCNQQYSATVETRTMENKEKSDQKGQLEQAISRAEDKIRRGEQELEEVRNKIRDLDILKKEVEYKRSNLVEKILNTYKVNLAELNIEIQEAVNREEMEREIEELKEKLDRMGEVSLGAMEEYDQLKERYDFLVKQRDDLVKGEEMLLQAIAKLNRTTRKMFVETFEAIRTEFSSYFRMLFGGGKADLILTDETNLLESGVDIVAKPPGKKLQNIMLLSGGEKALTAIALVFAIFKVNPSPFCILDEVDAPLDESNVVRFSRVLQEFLKTSQFIIVTHNRTTIRLADVLYGVTMQEKGVSRIVSVKFAEEDEISEEEVVPAAV